MSKHTKFVCQNCGSESKKWIGKCPACSEWNTYVEEESIEIDQKVIKKITDHSKEIVKLSDVGEKSLKRIPTGFVEFDKALGNGLVHDHVLFVSGEPGIGKSTLILQTAEALSKNNNVLYVSAEESAEQVSGRYKRLFGNDASSIQFLSNPSLGIIEESIKKVEPAVVIIDSIQTIFDEQSGSLPGSVTQVKNTASKLVYLAKSKGIILIIIGHVNKDGNIAGPKVLEHLVDTVVSIEGEKDSEIRFLKVLKNRFGSTSEVGLLKMTFRGLEDFKFDIESKNLITESLIGSIKTIAFEGSRPFIVDIQALVSRTTYPYPKRVAEGLSMSKLQLIVAILTANKIVNLTEHDVYVKVTEGLKIKDHPYTDLAVAMAIVSSAKKIKVKQAELFLGELNLNGTVKVTDKLKEMLKTTKNFFSGLTIITSLINK